MNKSLTAVLLLVFAALLAFSGCSGAKKKAVEVKPMSVATVTIQTPPGALPEVPADKGGDGFDKIATAQGWTTKTDAPLVGDSTAKKGGMFRMALTEFPSNLRNEGKDANTTVNSLMASMCYEALLGLHSTTREYTPGLASHWKISDDKKTFWFRIDPRARWSDGSRVTTADVIATWKLLVDPGILAPYSNQLYGKYDEPVAESPYILRVSTKELNWRHFLYFAVSMTILPAKEISIPGKEYLEKYQFKMVMGSGLYVIQQEDIIKDVSITLTRRSDYWGKDDRSSIGSGNFDKVKFVIVQDERLTFEKFKKGEVDFYYISRAQWWKEEFEFDHVKRGLIQKRKVYNFEPQGINGFVMNMRRAPFSDKRVREAIVRLIDRKKLIEKLFYDEYLPLNSYFPSSDYENPNNPKFDFDVDKASKLLAEAGWDKRDGEGYLLKNGKRFQLDMLIMKAQERYMTVIQEDFKRVGIKLDLKESTPATMFKIVNERKFDIHFQSWTGLQFPNPESSMHSKTADPDNTTNLPGIKNKRIDQICDEYNVTFGNKERIKQIREVDSLACSEIGYALGWYGPFNRFAYWNKFGMPKSILSRTGDWMTAITLWWYEPELDAQMQEGMKDPSKSMPVGETENKYWLEWTKQNNMKGDI